MQKTQIRFVRNRTGADKRRKFKFYEICLQCSKLAMTYLFFQEHFRPQNIHLAPIIFAIAPWDATS
jgi:hypothetical protein